MPEKAGAGKLDLDLAVDEVRDLAETSGFVYRRLSDEAVYNLANLPSIHKDPFDRLLIAEALALNASLCTPDQTIHQYPVEILW